MRTEGDDVKRFVGSQRHRQQGRREHEQARPQPTGHGILRTPDSTPQGGWEIGRVAVRPRGPGESARRTVGQSGPELTARGAAVVSLSWETRRPQLRNVVVRATVWAGRVAKAHWSPWRGRGGR